MKIIATYNSYKFSYKFTFTSFCPFLEAKLRIKFHQVGGLVTRNISAPRLKQVALYFKAMPNSIYFIKEFCYVLFLFVLQFHDCIEKLM